MRLISIRSFLYSAGLAGLLLLTKGEAAELSYVGVCPDAATQLELQAERYAMWPGGGARRLIVRQTPFPKNQCKSLALPIPASEINWAKAVPGDTADLLNGLILTMDAGTKPGKHVEVDALPPSEGPGDPTAMPVNLPLLPRMYARAFGVNRRATVLTAADGSVSLTCRAGSNPAGMVLQGEPWYLPAIPRVAVALTASGTHPFVWAMSDSRKTRETGPQKLGQIPPTATPASIRLPIPQNAHQWDSWTVLCPETESRLTVSDLKLATPQAPVLAALPGVITPSRTNSSSPNPGASFGWGPPGQGGAKAGSSLPDINTDTPTGAPLRRDLFTWIWEPAHWQAMKSAKLAEWHARGVTKVYITVTMDEDAGEVTGQAELGQFISRARANGISVWAVEGSPDAILPESSGAFKNRTAILAAYNAAVAPNLRLAGIQYDIEPYLVEGFSLDMPSGNLQLATLMHELKDAAGGMPIESVLPFWYASQRTVDGRFLEAIQNAVDGIAIMDYRTNAFDIEQGAEAYLSWGAQHNKPVTVALESGPLPDQVESVYHPGPTGTLWTVTLDNVPIVISLKKPQANPLGRAYVLSHTIPVPFGRTTFHGNRERLWEMLPDLQATFSTWPSFAGMALHETLD